MSDNLERVGNLDLSYPGLDIAAELTALRYHLRSLVDYLPTIQDQFRVRALRKLRAHAADIPPEEMFAEEDHVDHVAMTILPRMYRGPYLVSLWALYESGAVALAKYIGRREKAALALADVRATTFRERLEKYFDGVLKMPMPISTATFAALAQLQELRNFLAHTNGRIVEGDESTRVRILKIVSNRSDMVIEDGVLIVSSEYLGEALNTVTEALAALDGLCATRYQTISLIALPTPGDA